MDLRTEFIDRVMRGERVTDLCREYGISRKTGDKFKQRFKRMGQAGLANLSRAPKVIPHRTPPELVEMIDAASFVAVNDYEASLLSERTGLSVEAIARRVDALIVTLGGAGARIHAEGSTLDIPAVTAESVVDPTGCGDAFRAGLLYGIASGWDWQRSGRLASTLGALKIASRGGQNHALTRDRVATAYHEAFHAHLF